MRRNKSMRTLNTLVVTAVLFGLVLIAEGTAQGQTNGNGSQSNGANPAHDIASSTGTATTVAGMLTQLGQNGHIVRGDIQRGLDDYARRGFRPVNNPFPYAQPMERASKYMGRGVQGLGVVAGVTRAVTATNDEDRVLGVLNATASAIPGPVGTAASIGVTAGEMIGNVDTGLTDPRRRQKTMTVRDVLAEGIASVYIQPKSGSIVKEWVSGWKDLFR